MHSVWRENKGRPCFVEHKQLKSLAKSTQKKKKFFVSVEHRAILQFLIFYRLCPLVWSTEIERDRGNEKVGGKQAKLNGRGSGRELEKGDETALTSSWRWSNRERRRNFTDEQREREQERSTERRRSFTDEQREREQERSTERRHSFTEERWERERKKQRTEAQFH